MSDVRDVSEVRIGVVGTGFLAETRARCWARVAGARVTGVASREPAGARTYADRHGVETAFDTAHALFESDSVDAVDLCVPNRVHRSLAEAAAGAGKHVICTKPLAAYVGQDLPEAERGDAGRRRRMDMYRVALGDARAMVEACTRAGVQLCYGENWIYAPGLRRAEALLDTADAALLEMRGWECHSGSHSGYAKRWQHTGGGALLRLGAHPVGAMLHLKRREGARRGERVTAVAVTAEVADLTRVAGASASNTRIATGWDDVENWGTVVIHFSDGSRGVAIGSDNALGGMESRLELYGSNCKLVCNMSPNDLVRAYAPDSEVFGDAYLQEKQSTTAGWSTPMPDEDWTSGQLAMCQAFADAIRSGAPAASDGSLGLEVTRVLYGAYVAAESGRRIALADLDSAG